MTYSRTILIFELKMFYSLYHYYFDGKKAQRSYGCRIINTETFKFNEG